MHKRNTQAGAVSLFVVIFSMLLLTVITVSFLRIMMTDLRQSSDSDLSNSAYDSAQAGVEDAKRSLLAYQAFCNQPGVTQAACDSKATQLSSSTCNDAVRATGVAPSGTGEVPVQSTTSSSESANFKQAYTCVTMNLNTDDVSDTLTEGTSKFVPLRGVSDFNQVTISWYSSQNDLPTPSSPVSLTNQTSPLKLYPRQNWPVTRPPIVRAQVIQIGSSFQQSDFDIVNSSSQSNTNTLFLYPTTDGNTAAAFIGRDIRANSPTDSPDADTPGSSPLATKCSSAVASGGYACSITLDLPTPINGNRQVAYLRLTSFYKGADFQVKLLNSAAPVQFKAVQPLIDSTGRANDLYRRVQARVELTDSSLPLPEAGVDVTTEFCKDFSVSDTFVTSGQCVYS